MITRTVICFLPLIISDIRVLAHDISVNISTDDPIVKGATINFQATVYDGNVVSNFTNLTYNWLDNGIPQNEARRIKKNATDLWIVTYDADLYARGPYIVKVVVENCFILCYEIASASTYFNITETVNGNMRLVQGSRTVDNDFVSNADTVVHELEIKETDWNYIKNATKLATYWFIDCTYYAITADMKFPFNYTLEDKEHIVETLLMVNFTPSTTTEEPTINTATDVKGSGSNIMLMDGMPKVSYSGSFPYVCNGSKARTDSKRTYGYFSRKIRVRAPISNVNVTGNTTIRHGDLLSLNVECQGSAKLDYCVQYKEGLYNVTGNETCDPYISLQACDFHIYHYFTGSEYTVIIIIRNEVSKMVRPVWITLYDEETAYPISAVLVVSFIIVAMVIIVFVKCIHVLLFRTEFIDVTKKLFYPIFHRGKREMHMVSDENEKLRV